MRLYENWPGANRFLCNGKIILGNAPKLLPFTILSLLFVCIYESIFLIPKYYNIIVNKSQAIMHDMVTLIYLNIVTRATVYLFSSDIDRFILKLSNFSSKSLIFFLDSLLSFINGLP